jgi:hypothetical protein
MYVANKIDGTFKILLNKTDNQNCENKLIATSISIHKSTPLAHQLFVVRLFLWLNQANLRRSLVEEGTWRRQKSGWAEQPKSKSFTGVGRRIGTDLSRVLLLILAPRDILS